MNSIRSGYFIAIIGTDGAGKSTIIRGLRDALASPFSENFICSHLRPNFLPSIGSLFGKPFPEESVTNPHAAQPSGFFGSLLRLSYYSLDYVFGYWINIFPALVRRPALYVFDRYFYDYYIDPRRGRIKLPKWIIRLYDTFIPAPDVILCLGTAPDVIQSRKPELPLDEVKRQVKALKNFCQSNKRAVWIDTGCSIEESVDQALAAMTTRLAVRYGR